MSFMTQTRKKEEIKLNTIQMQLHQISTKLTDSNTPVCGSEKGYIIGNR